MELKNSWGLRDYQWENQASLGHLTCSLCKGLFYKPVGLNCPHVFCKPCIGKALARKRVCPTCGAKVTKKTPSELLAKVVKDLQVRCKNKKRGCKNKVKLGTLSKHLRECGYGIVACRHDDCGARVLRKHLTYHEEQCPLRMIRCTKGCTQWMTAAQQKEHRCVETLLAKLRELEEKQRQD